MSALLLEDIYSGYSYKNTFLSPDAFEKAEPNINVERSLNSAFMINVTLKGMNDTHLSFSTPDMLLSNKNDSESELLETDAFLFERFKRLSMEFAANKAAKVQAVSNFEPIRDCYGVVDRIYEDEKKKQLCFEARMYKNTSNEFVEIICAPVSAFKKSDSELLSVGSVFYWKVGYRFTAKGTKVKVNEFNLRRIIREKSILRTKRVEKVVDEFLSIFK